MTLDIKKVLGWEKFCVNQEFNRYLFEGNSEFYEKTLFSFLEKNANISFPKKSFEVSELHSIDEMASSPTAVSFICFLANLIRPHLALEIGTFVGFTTANLAKCLNDNGILISVEKFEHFAEIAKRNLSNCGVSEKVTLKIGDAKTVVPDLEIKDGTLDFAFVDGNKEDYLEYIEHLLPKLSQRGILLVDDCFFHGDIFNESPKTEKGLGVKKAIRQITKNQNIDLCFVPISNGMAIISKSN